MDSACCTTGRLRNSWPGTPVSRGGGLVLLDAGLGYLEVAVVGEAFGDELLQLWVGEELLPGAAGQRGGISRGRVAVEAGGGGFGAVTGMQQLAAAGRQQEQRGKETG